MTSFSMKSQAKRNHSKQEKLIIASNLRKILLCLYGIHSSWTDSGDGIPTIFFAVTLFCAQLLFDFDPENQALHLQ